MPRPPNILLITADQIRFDALGCCGNPVCRTPNLDRLARSGVVFENAYSPNPICVPARACITTGNYSHRCTDSKDNDGRIGDDQVKLAAHFAAAGYATYACGKLHYVPYSPPGQPRLLHGFQHCDLTESGRLVNQFDPKCKLRGLEDYIDYLSDAGWPGYSRAHGVGNNDVRPCPSPLPAEHHVDHWVADRTIQRLGEHLAAAADQPFLIWCSFPKPHSPYDPPFEFAHLYDPRRVPPPFGDESMLADRNPEIQRTRISHGQDSLSPAARQVIKAYYYGLITFHDEQVGRVLAALDEAGVAGDTIVIYTADHGDLIGDFGGYFKGVFLEGSAHIPFLARVPGWPGGARRGQLVGLQDVLPTLAGLAGCPLPRAVDGVDLAPAAGSDSAVTRDLFYGQCGNPPEQSAFVCDGRWKYSHSQWGGVEELYDLASDPHELVNLASRPGGQGLARPWRQRLIAEARRWGDDALLSGEDLAVSPLDRQALLRLPITGMGWRWF